MPPIQIPLAFTTASRSSIRCLRRRSCRCSAPTGFSCSTRSCCRSSSCAATSSCTRVQVRSSPSVLASGFVMASRRAGLFRLADAGGLQLLAGVLAYFCWLYKEVARAGAVPGANALALQRPRRRRCRDAARHRDVLEGDQRLYSSPPIVVWQLWGLWRRQSPRVNRVIASMVAFALLAGGLFAINMAHLGRVELSGRRSRDLLLRVPVPERGPEARPWVEQVARRDDERHHLQSSYVHVEPDAQSRILFHRPSTRACWAISFRRSSRSRPFCWRRGSARRGSGSSSGRGCCRDLSSSSLTPYTWHGGGVGNRYFFSGYGVMLFLLPPIQSATAVVRSWAVGGLFVAPMVLNPFVASFHPDDNAKSGPLRLLPVELTLVNDLPVNNEHGSRPHLVRRRRPGRSRIPGLLPRRQRLRSRRRQELLDSRRTLVPSSSSRPIDQSGGRPSRSSAGPVATDVTHHDRRPQPGDAPRRLATRNDVAFAMPAGLPYEKEVQALALDGVRVEQQRVHANLLRCRFHRHPLPRRSRQAHARSEPA